MKQVYIVSGSEDGILGVYGNKKAAYNKAMEYTEGKIYQGHHGEIKPMSYAKVCKALDSKNYYDGYVDIYDHENVAVGAEIIMKTLNK
jgi:hypothetical protein